MAKILYRQTLTPVEPNEVSAGSAVKNAPLTLAEGDYNYKALNDDIQARAALSGATFTGDVSVGGQLTSGNANFTGTVAGLTKTMVGLANVDNTSDANKPVSTATQTALNAKQDTLVSGTHIKTINGASVLGTGDLAVTGGIIYTRHTTNVTAVDKQGIIADTSGGTFTVTLPATPAIGTQVVIADGGDWQLNNLTVARNGSTIENSTENLIMDVGGIQVHCIYDGTTWETFIQTGSITYNPTSSNMGVATFSGNGSTTQFTLTEAPGTLQSVEVFIGGVRQYPTQNYTISGNSLIFVVAPPSGTDNIFVRWLSALPIGTVADSQITLAKLDATLTQTLNGKVTGPASATDNTLPRFDGATGKLLQGSGVVVSDSNSLETNVGATYGGYRVKGVSSASNGFELALSSNGTTGNLWLYENASMRFATNNIEHMVLDSSGNLTTSGNITVGGILSSPRTSVIVNSFSAFTSTAGNVYVLTGQCHMDLPASPSAGNWVSVVNRSGLLTNTIGRNGQNIMGLAENMTLDNASASLTLVFADATRGWVWA